jgi:acetylornithine deacetylase
VSEFDAVALTQDLVRIDSRNPTLVEGAPGELRVAESLARTLERWGFSVEMPLAAPNRPNVIARAGRAAGPRLMLNGHLDVVGVEGMTHAPFEAQRREGKIFGRGAADMKAGLASMCAAAASVARHGIQGEVIITAVVDEEATSVGTRALVRNGIGADAAIIAEPTSLAIMPAHKGFAWVEIEVHGRSAHGSRYDKGVDAIMHAAAVLAELEQLDRDALTHLTHPLLGRASLHGATIAGGQGWSTYPDRCTVRVERRTLPGESRDAALAETRAIVERLTRDRPSFSADARLVLVQDPSDVSIDAPIVQALSRVLERCGEPVRIAGMSAWTDAALLNESGIPAICFGPGDISQAHAAEESVSIDEIERATRVFEALIADWCNGGSSECS